jgi:hypothetical protein
MVIHFDRVICRSLIIPPMIPVGSHRSSWRDVNMTTSAAAVSEGDFDGFLRTVCV